ncbi:BREX-1 system adenine-specific DNA-methyltransferase PglX, partial [Synechocystis salina]|uniref:BREX-1 system adenine-specific DNA-methyltransferase PglX n=1 Tax=Synechocystis salina TaxID=945780 RepID=UPI0018810226
MKLADHVQQLRQLIEASFDKTLARLGIGKTQSLAVEKLPDHLRLQRLRLDEMLTNHTGEVGGYELARAKLLDELTFTLFNRLAAIKVMEAARLFPPILTKQAEHGDRSFGHLAWLELNADGRGLELEGIDVYLQSEFDKLGRMLPLYAQDYAFGLLPDAISLNGIIEQFNQVEKDPQVGAEIWLSDDVLGWLYESYNAQKKQAHKDSKAKTEFDKVSLQSQVYTPRWVVQFLVENSLGKLYLEMFPNSPIRDRFKIANAPTVREREPQALTKIKVIDPACGSGNFLLYAFDFFYELYLDQINTYGADYEEKEIPQLIIEHNLHGIDLDDRAVQLAQLGLFIKARRRCRSLASLRFRVVSSDFFLPDYGTVRDIFEEGSDLDGDQRQLIQSIWGDLRNAYKFGSLIRLDEKLRSRISFFQQQIAAGDNPLLASAFLEEEKDFATKFFANLRQAIAGYAQGGGNQFLSDKTADAVTFLEVLNSKYDVALANPPYTDSSDFGANLKGFIDENYKKPEKFNTNLYATFIKRCYELTNEAGKLAMIHPRTFMFIKTFDDVRKFILNNVHVNIFVDYSLSNLFGSIMVDPAFYILEKGIKKEKESLFISLDQYTRTPNEKFKKDFCLQALNDHIAGIENEHNYVIPQAKLKIIKSWPFIYWISDEFRAKFGKQTIESFGSAKPGLQTGSNERFLRFWWELDREKLSSSIKDDLRWKNYAKGGDYQKWSGNLSLYIDWENNGEKLEKYAKSLLRNSKFYFKEGITYSASGSKGVSFRYLPENCVFDVGGASIFLNNKEYTFYTISLLNSIVSKYVINCLNPTVNTQKGDIDRVPFVESNEVLKESIIKLAQVNVSIINKKKAYSIIEQKFRQHPLLNLDSWQKNLFNYFNYENHRLT